MTDRTADGGPAFPCIEPTLTGISSDGEERYENEAHGGMTLRDYFAAKAMAPMVQNRMTGSAQYGNEAEIAARAYEIADAMLAARNQTNTKD